MNAMRIFRVTDNIVYSIITSRSRYERAALFMCGNSSQSYEFIKFDLHCTKANMVLLYLELDIDFMGGLRPFLDFKSCGCFFYIMLSYVEEFDINMVCQGVSESENLV